MFGTTAFRHIAGGTAAAITAPIMENISMGFLEDREHSAEEIATRSVRSAGLGVASYATGTAATSGFIAVMFGSAATGAATGSVVPFWGTAVGLVIGIGVGATTYYYMDQHVPGGRADFDRDIDFRNQAEAQQRRRAAEQQRQLVAERVRQQRLNTPLDRESASTAGVEAMFNMPTNNPLFIMSDSGLEPVVGDLESAYITSVLDNGQTSL